MANQELLGYWGIPMQGVADAAVALEPILPMAFDFDMLG
jgi:hypothetical protein